MDQGRRIYLSSESYREEKQESISGNIATLRLTQLYRKVQPDIVHHVAMKPILYGSLAARLAGIPAVVNAFGGLGYVFTARGMSCQLLRIALTVMLRTALALPNSRVVLQTRHDWQRVIREKLARQDQTIIIPGVGVDMASPRSRPVLSAPLYRSFFLPVECFGIRELEILFELLRC